MYKHIIGIDPSGNFKEGKGTTGIVRLRGKQLLEHKAITAKNFNDNVSYWAGVIQGLKYWCVPNTIVVIEDYILYPDKTSAQSYSKLETPRLIGVLEYYLWSRGIPYVFQNASLVKKRWTDEILKKQFPQKLNGHERDALRHAIHYATFKNKDKTKQDKPKEVITFTNYKEDK